MVVTFGVFGYGRISKWLMWLCLRIKALDTFGNCQRPVFSLGVYQHNLLNLWAQYWSSKLQQQQQNEKKKTPFLHNFVCFQMDNKKHQSINILG